MARERVGRMLGMGILVAFAGVPPPSFAVSSNI